MSWLSFKAKLLKYPVKAIIFRKTLPTKTDYAARISKKKENYKLLGQKRVIPSPPSNDYIQLIDGKPHIFLMSPRIGTYIYMRTPEINHDPEKQELKIKYLTRVKDAKGMLVEEDFAKETVKVDLKNNRVSSDDKKRKLEEIRRVESGYHNAISEINNRLKTLSLMAKSNKWTDEQKNLYKQQLDEKRKEYYEALKEFSLKKKELDIEELTNIKVVEVSFELMDHDDISFLAQETQQSESKYAKKESFWEKHGTFILGMAYFIAIAVGIYITYQQIVFPAAKYAIRDGITVVCNSTSGAGTVL